MFARGPQEGSGWAYLYGGLYDVKPILQSCVRSACDGRDVRHLQAEWHQLHTTVLYDSALNSAAEQTIGVLTNTMCSVLHNALPKCIRRTMCRCQTEREFEDLGKYMHVCQV